MIVKWCLLLFLSDYRCCITLSCQPIIIVYAWKELLFVREIWECNASSTRCSWRFHPVCTNWLWRLTVDISIWCSYRIMLIICKGDRLKHGSWVTTWVSGKTHRSTLYMLHVVRLVVVVIIALHHHELGVGSAIRIQSQSIFMLHHVAASTGYHLIIMRDEWLAQRIGVSRHIKRWEG